MAAGIEVRTLANGEVRESYVGTQPAWHGLGKVYDAPISVKEAIEGCHADFTVTKQPIIATTPELESFINGEATNPNMNFITNEAGRGFVSIDYLRKYIIESHVATMRGDLQTTLGVVGSNYQIIQNSQAFSFIDLLCTGKQGEVPCIESAGVLWDGKQVFVVAKFPEVIKASKKDGDVINQYMVITTGHENTALTVMATPVRVVCANTLASALRNNSGKIVFRHTVNVGQRLDLTNKENAQRVYQALHLQNTYSECFQQEIEALQKVQLNDREAEEILVKSILPEDAVKAYFKNGNDINANEVSTRARNIILGVKDTYFTGIGQDLLENGTAWKLYNAVSCYYQNNANWTSSEKKYTAIIDGGSVTKKMQALHDLLIKKAA